MPRKRRCIRQIFRNSGSLPGMIFETKIPSRHRQPQETNSGRERVKFQLGRRISMNQFGDQVLDLKRCCHFFFPGFTSTGFRSGTCSIKICPSGWQYIRCWRVLATNCPCRSRRIRSGCGAYIRPEKAIGGGFSRGNEQNWSSTSSIKRQTRSMASSAVPAAGAASKRA